MTQSLQQAIERNRKRWADKRAGILPAAPQPAERLKRYTVSVVVCPPVYLIEMGLATTHRETRVIYGTSKADAMKRADIQ